jgi:prepilin-type N-terminal cleavage/methylation domain-containing protein
MKTNGFTLIELLTALAIGALLLTGLTTTLSGFSDELTRARKADHMAAQANALASIDSMLEASSFVDDIGKPLPHNDTELNFRIRTPLSVGGSGWMPMQLAVQQRAAGAQLILIQSQTPDRTAPTIIVDDADKIILSQRYEYDNASQQDRLSMITITVVDGGNLTHKIIANPMISTGAYCVFDPISQACRL